jgi:WD40 repeat protein
MTIPVSLKRPLVALTGLSLLIAAQGAWGQSGGKLSEAEIKLRQETMARLAAQAGTEIEAAQAARAAAAKISAPLFVTSRATAGAPAPVVTAPAAAPVAATAPAVTVPASAVAATAPAAAAPLAVLSAPSAIAKLAQSAGEQRLALVIGNSDYRSSPLTNPVNDARAMAFQLTALGFTVIKKENASLADMMNAVRDFGSQLSNGGVGLFYYAGHGIQSKGQNFLVPVDADIRNEDELSTRAYNANEVLAKMETADNRINMVILDACRDNPFARSFRSGGRGLAGMDQTPKGTLVAYATSPGSTASDGVGANGLYTAQLLRAMAEPGIKLEEVFKRVRNDVMEFSNGKQVPWEMSSMRGDFYFKPTKEQMAIMATPSTSGGGSGGGIAAPAALARHVLPVLVSRKLVDHYQMTGSFPLESAPTVATFTRNGNYFALGAKDRTLKTFSTLTGAALSTETSYISSYLAQDRNTLLSLTEDGHVNLHALQTEVKRRNVDALPAGVRATSLSPNGKRLLVYADGGGFSLYDSANLALVVNIKNIDGSPNYAWSPNSEFLLTWGDGDEDMHLWAADTGRKIARMTNHSDPVGMARFSNDSQVLVTSANSDKTIVWRTSDGQRINKFELGEDNPLPKAMEVFNNGKYLLVHAVASRKIPGSPLQLAVWDTATGQKVASLLPDGVELSKLRMVQSQNRIFITGSDRNTYVFDMTTLKKTVISGMEFVDVSADARRFLLKNNDGVRLMDTQTMVPVSRMPAQVNAFAANKGDLFATSASDGNVTLWRFDSGDRVGELKGHLDTVTDVVFSDDGRHLVSMGADNTWRMWTVPEIQNMQKLAKDQFESTAEYNARVADWSSPYTSMVTLVSYNADAATYNVRFGDIEAAVPLDRDAAKQLTGQRSAIIKAKLKHFDGEHLILSESTLSRLP